MMQGYPLAHALAAVMLLCAFALLSQRRLAAIGMPGMPFIAELSVALLVLAGLLVAGVFVFQLREHFETLDLSGIEEIERRGR